MNVSLCVDLIKRILLYFFKLLVFWLAVFDFERILFSIYNWGKFADVSFVEWLLAFYYSLRLDLATASLLSFIPFVFILFYVAKSSKSAKKIIHAILLMEVILCALIHGGEINAYPEWNHKLTTRVFTHLLNPDEVVRTADYGMTIWFFVFSIIEIIFGDACLKLLFKFRESDTIQKSWLVKLPLIGFMFASLVVGMLVLARGGTQPIPINTDAAYYSSNYVANDLSVNSVYFFTKSFLLYNREESGAMFPIISERKIKHNLADFYSRNQKHAQYILKNSRPNLVFIVLESWTANAIHSISGKPGATPYFDKLTRQGLLFTNIYATGGTSEVGNSSIFSGYPALPEIWISMQPDKHRKIPCLNQDLKQWGYTSHYLFSGDLKYGNIGSYFVDHGFDSVEDETIFPKVLKRGKLNYYDEDLYSLLLKKINHTRTPFLVSAFTGSTHSPYDFPKKGVKQWKGKEADFMSSLYYADKSLYRFLNQCKQHTWYKNTLFVLVADHGHASPDVENPNLSAYFHIPLLFFGEPLKKEYRGKRIETIGSQSDIVATLLYQLKGNINRYPWSKDLLNPVCPQFALHTINRGYGWINPQGNFSYNMDGKNYTDNTYQPFDLVKQKDRCHSFMSLVYKEYKGL